MPELSANLSMLFTDLPFMLRFSAAAQAGFRLVEIQFPYAWNARDILSQLQEHDLELVLFNLPVGEWEAGDRGIAANWDRREEFLAGLDQAMEYADVLQPRAINLLAGASDETAVNDLALLQNIRIAAETLAEEGLTLLMEPINTVDVPGFALPTAFAALDVIAEIDAANIRLQLDLYHALTMNEDPLQILHEHTDMIGHIQIADVPGRHEPGTGEIDWDVFFATLEAVDYRGVVGLEYIPIDDTNASFSLLKNRGFLN